MTEFSVTIPGTRGVHAALEARRVKVQGERFCTSADGLYRFADETYEGTSTGDEDVRPLRQFVYDGSVAVRLDLHTAEAVVPSFDLFDVTSGLIQSVEAFHDPRPILSALAGRGQPPFLDEV